MEIEILDVLLPEIHCEAPAAVDFDIDKPTGDLPPIYDGETAVVPTDAMQILRTKNHVVTDNIVIQPIPSNYGRVSYNGATLFIE